MRTNKLLVIGSWYRIRLGKFGNRVYLTVDNVTNSAMISNGGVLNLAGEPIYLGKFGDHFGKLKFNCDSVLRKQDRWRCSCSINGHSVALFLKLLYSSTR